MNALPTPRAPLRVTASAAGWPLHDTAASRGVEAAAIAAHAPGTLMARAGHAVARLAMAIAPHARRVDVWCGGGNNGGDGLVAARHLHAAGRTVAVTLLGDPARLPADAAAALADAVAAGVAVTGPGASDTGRDADIVIDALLGLGARRAPAGDFAEAIAAINAADRPVVAIDLPSGLHPDTGALLGDAAVRATATLALLTIKPGCWTGHGRDHCGDFWFDDLGVDVDAAPSAWLTAPPQPARRRHAAHKGSFGDCIVVGGASGMVGAAWLAARAALAAGAGRVWLSLLDASSPTLDPTRPELMSKPAAWLASPDLLAKSTVVCGCGGGDAVRDALPPLLAHAGRLVLDADAINAAAADASIATLLRSRSARGAPTLLTPHPLEAARLIGCSAAQVQHDRWTAARRIADDTGATVLLKGSGTLIAATGRTTRVNPTGNAALATGGTGDVLAGWTGGRWSQRAGDEAADVAADAAWQHGAAADDHVAAGGGSVLRAGALVDRLARRG